MKINYRAEIDKLGLLEILRRSGYPVPTGNHNEVSVIINIPEEHYGSLGIGNIEVEYTVED